MKLITIVYAGLLSLFSSTVFAEPPRSAGENALAKAMFLLNNPAAREEYIRNSESAQNAHETLRDLAGSEQTMEEMYRLASDIFANIMLKTNGDPDKLRQLLEEAEQEPGSFASSLTPVQKKMLGELAQKVKRNRQ